MSDTFTVKLADRQWSLPHLPFGVIKNLQPRIFEFSQRAAPLGAPDEAALDLMVDVVVGAIQHVEPEFSRDTLLALHFSVMDLLAAQAAVSEACGLKRREPGEPPPEGEAYPKALSTTSSPA